jgi:hypothetical protein
VSEEEAEACHFATTRLRHVCAGNQFSFIPAIEPGDETKRALHNRPHKTGRKGYHGKMKEW